MGNNQQLEELKMTGKAFKNSRQRMKVGRAQKEILSTHKMINIISWENYTWVYMIFSSVVLYVILYFNLQTVSQILPTDFFELIVLNTFIITISCLIGRMLYNLIVQAIMKYGMNRHKHIVNTLTSFIDSIIVLPLFIVFFYFMVLVSAVFLSVRKVLLSIVLNLLLPQGEAHPMVLLFICVIAGMYIVGLFTTLFLYFHSIRSIVNLINSLFLLPPDNKLNNDYRIKNYHYSDYDFMNKLYLNTMNRNSPQNVYLRKDFDNFLKATGAENIRVLFKNSERIGFYSVYDNRSVLQHIMITSEYKGQDIHKYFIQDFEKINTRRKTKTITVSLPEKDISTGGYLLNNGWEKSEETKNFVTFEKLI